MKVIRATLLFVGRAILFGWLLFASLVCLCYVCAISPEPDENEDAK